MTVWREDNFRLSHASGFELQKHGRIEPCLRARLAYGDCERTTPVDMIVFDTQARTLRSYNVKRGNGSYDGGKRRIILDGLLRTHMLLRGYGLAKGVDAVESQSHIIFYYGVCSIGDPFSITADQLDDHFAFPVRDAVEAVNTHFRERLHSLIEQG